MPLRLWNQKENHLIPQENFDYDEDDEQAFTNIVPDADAIDKNGKPINQQYLTDLIINSEVLLVGNAPDFYVIQYSLSWEYMCIKYES